VLLASVALSLLLACGGGSGLSGTVKVDGSSTVFPITEAMAEEFQLLHPRVRLTVGVSGTGGGFKKFCRGETDISDASRPIKQSEIELCAKNGIEFLELPVAFDGLSVIVNPENDWATWITVDELKRIWEPGSEVERWSDVRPHWPDENLLLVGADTDSGTFDYFTEAIVGEEGASRTDYIASANDNVLVQAVSSERFALGYFGYAYYRENKGKLKLVAVDPGSGSVLPSEQTISGGLYQPLSRPLLIYVSRSSLEDKPEVVEFVQFYLDPESVILVKDVGYVGFPAGLYQLVNQRLLGRVTGTMFPGGSQVGLTIEELLAEE